MWKLSVQELFPLTDNSHHVLKIVVFSIAISVFISKAWKSLSTRRVRGEIPGNLGLPYIGETFSFLSATNSIKGIYEFVRLRRLCHGKWFKTRIFGKTHIFAPSPEAAKAIFSTEFVQFKKGYVKSMGDAVGNGSLFCVPHDRHKRIRRLLTEPFSMNSLAKYVQRIDVMMSERLKRLQEKGESFRVLDFSSKVGFDSLCAVLMGIYDPSLLDQIKQHCNDITKAMLTVPLMIPGTRYYRGMKAREKVMQIIREKIARRREGRETGDDFLQTMLERDPLPDDETLSDEEIMDNLLTMLLAGQSTTAAGMMWSVKFLDENPKAQEILREEQLSIAKSKAPGDPLTMEDLKAMSYGSKVIKETLRMSNVVLWYPRAALVDCVIDGIEVKKGWHVNIDAAAIHYDPSNYKNPFEFNPSRFDERPKPYTFMPYGLGPKTCLGMNMAKVTVLVFLYRLTSGFRWKVEDEDSSLEKKSFIPRLRNGCPITLMPLNNRG